MSVIEKLKTLPWQVSPKRMRRPKEPSLERRLFETGGLDVRDAEAVHNLTYTRPRATDIYRSFNPTEIAEAMPRRPMPNDLVEAPKERAAYVQRIVEGYIQSITRVQEHVQDGIDTLTETADGHLQELHEFYPGRQLPKPPTDREDIEYLPEVRKTGTDLIARLERMKARLEGIGSDMEKLVEAETVYGTNDYANQQELMKSLDTTRERMVATLKRMYKNDKRNGPLKTAFVHLQAWQDWYAKIDPALEHIRSDELLAEASAYSAQLGQDPGVTARPAGPDS